MSFVDNMQDFDCEKRNTVLSSFNCCCRHKFQEEHIITLFL